MYFVSILKTRPVLIWNTEYICKIYVLFLPVPRASLNARIKYIIYSMNILNFYISLRFSTVYYSNLETRDSSMRDFDDTYTKYSWVVHALARYIETLAALYIKTHVYYYQLDSQTLRSEFKFVYFNQFIIFVFACCNVRRAYRVLVV